MTFEKLSVGLKNSVAQAVTANDTALAVGSGSLNVLATPKMLALMEKAAADLAEANLPAEWTSVGISLNVEHIAPTPVGMQVRAEAELVEFDGRKIIFSVAAYDECGEIGRGRHERFIVNREKFQAKANAKKNS
ncbi:MAG: thioesterase family protein [Selenomonadaceae bacterium]|nr:thioesterase family protein [Selenomonadaceae bacterium]